MPRLGSRVRIPSPAPIFKGFKRHLADPTEKRPTTSPLDSFEIPTRFPTGTRNWQIQAGYTFVKTDFDAIYQNVLANLTGGGAQSLDGSIVALFNQQPRHQAKLWTSYTLPGKFAAWSVGGGFRLESARTTVGTTCTTTVNPISGRCPRASLIPFTFRQDLDTIQDLRVAYDFDKHWQAQLNVTNLADKRYYATAGNSTTGNFYGEPRRIVVALRALY